MCEVTIPSSPSWYLSNVLACNDDGSAIAYGAKHELAIMRPSVQSSSMVCGKPFESQPIFIPMAHKDKINALAFAPFNPELLYQNQLVSCSDDGTVHVWDWSVQALLLSHCGHQDGQKVVAVDWSRADPNLIVSISDQGSLVSWDLANNRIRRLRVSNRVQTICIAACPHNKELVAIGAKVGLVLVYNIKGDGHVNFRLRGHETDVVSLAWCPVPYNVFKDQSEPDSDNPLLLASGSKDRSIYFWRAGSDGRYETFINLPTQPVATTGYRSKGGVGGQGNNWVCVRWPEKHLLLTSSLFGELLSYDLENLYLENAESNKKTKNKPPKLIHGNHSKGLFSIAVPSNQKNSKCCVVWSYALDKHLIGCNLETSKIVIDITTIGGIVYCMAASPIDPVRIAIGTGDNRILVWNTSNDSCDDVTTFWYKINCKVMAVAWHPTSESLLAFGTGEGRVGILDVFNVNKPPTLLRLYHRKSVYSLIWSFPIVKLESTKGKKSLYSLFSVGDGDILQYNIDTPDKDPIVLSQYFTVCDTASMVSKPLGRTDLAWRNDRMFAAVGNDNGVLYIVDGHTFTHLHTVFAHKKLIQCVVWHPETVTSEDALSPYSSWLATASDNIQIINVTREGIETVASLNTHSEKVVSLAWSPHFNGRLISASYDYTSQVWDVPSGSVLACFDGHHSSVICCLPSALHQDCVITGSADNTIRMWNINKFNLTKTKTKKQWLSGVLKKFVGVQEATDCGVLPIISQEFLEKGQVYPPAPNIQEVSTSAPVNSNYKKKSQSMFPITSSGTSQAKYLSILWESMNGETPSWPNTPEYAYLDFFGNSKAVRRLALAEGNHQKERGNIKYAQHLSIWSGDLSETIKTALRKRQLSDWLVGLAPMVSHKLWVDCCKTYASQLIESGETYHAVSYLLAIHQVEEAVDLLIEGKYFREAIVLAKSRFPTGDPTIKKALLSWGIHCVGTGSLNLAAHCMLSVGSNIEAVGMLSRSKDPATLALASDIAMKADAVEMGLSLAMRAINTALERQDYKTAYNAISKHESSHECSSVLKDIIVWINVCSLFPEWKPLETRVVIDWVIGHVLEKDKWPGLFSCAFDISGKFQSSYPVLLKYLPNKPTPDSEQKVWVYIAAQISLAAVAQRQPFNTKCVLRHLIQALEAAYNYHLHNPDNPHLFLQLAMWLSPDGPLSILPMLDETKKGLIESVCTFLACSVIHWLDLLNTKDELPYDNKESMNKLNIAVIKCAALLFNRDIIMYHKMDIEMKKLENALAAAKLKNLKSMKHCKDIEAVQLQEKNDEEKSNGEGFHHMTNGAESVMPDCEKLARIKIIKSQFEEERLFTPNPFITYCTLRNILQSIVNKRPELGNDTLVELSRLWEKSSSDE